MTPLRTVAPLIVAAALAAVAVATVQGAGCDDPGRYEVRAGGYELVGGCLAAGDIMIPEPVPPLAPPTDAATPAES